MSVLIVSDVTEGRAAEVEFDAFPSPWRALWQWLSPFHQKPNVPGLMNILTRTAVLGSVARDALARDAADLYLRMPVESYGILEMDRIDEIAEAGYVYTRDLLETGRASEADAPWYARVMAKAMET